MSSHLNIVVFMIIVGIALFLILVMVTFIYVDRFLRRWFSIEHPSNVHGYIQHRYVNRVHQIGIILIQALIVFVLLYSSLTGTFSWLMVHTFVISFLSMVLFDGFMQWKYPIQPNEYKKAACYIVLLLVLIPIFYLLVPADLFGFESTMIP